MKTIMVVEDHAIVREPIAASLRRDGYNVICASNGEEALAEFGRRPCDLVLLDIAMPVMDGLSMLAALRATPAGAAVPVIVLTALAERGHVVQAAKLGICGYLLKSRFSLDQMLAAVRSALASGSTPQSNSSNPGGGETTSPSMRSAPAPAVAAPRVVAAPALRRADAIAPTSSSAPEPDGESHDYASAAAEWNDDVVASLRSLKPIMTRSELSALIEGDNELKGFSPAVAEVLKITGNPRCAMDLVARAISRDHAIALKMLKLANSAVYTRGEPVDAVNKAVMRIGMEQIRQAVLNIAVVEQFAGTGAEGLIDNFQFWEHAIATGIIAAEIARSRDENEADAAFTMGLLHDVGKMVYLDRVGDPYRHVLTTARDLALPLEQVEHRMLHYNHGEIMDRVLRQWKFAKHLIDPIVFHHVSPGTMRKTMPKQAQAIGTLALADRLAHAFMLGASGSEIVYPTEELCEMLRLEPSVVQRIEQIARDETDKVKFALLVSANHPNWPQLRDVHRSELAAPLRPLYVSHSPAFDAHRIFCEQLSDWAEEGAAANLGVINLRDQRERVSLSEAFVAAEAKAGASNLPILVISPLGKIMPEASLLRGRRIEALATPFAIRRFIAAANRLLAPANEVAAAA